MCVLDQHHRCDQPCGCYCHRPESGRVPSSDVCLLGHEDCGWTTVHNAEVAGRVPSSEPTAFVPCGIDQQSQRQDSLRAQMVTVLDAARRLGCYDAMDWLHLSYFDREARDV